jgi:hypothetical protein
MLPVLDGMLANVMKQGRQVQAFVGGEVKAGKYTFVVVSSVDDVDPHGDGGGRLGSLRRREELARRGR